MLIDCQSVPGPSSLGVLFRAAFDAGLVVAHTWRRRGASKRVEARAVVPRRLVVPFVLGGPA